MEEALGVVLLERQSRGVRPTAAGGEIAVRPIAGRGVGAQMSLALRVAPARGALPEGFAECLTAFVLGA